MKTRFVCDRRVQCIPPWLMLSLVLMPALAVSAAPQGWREVVFEGHTKYRQVDGCWHALAQGTASGLVREQEVDLNQTPWLTWQWRGEVTPRWSDSPEQSKGGDDFQARVYVVKKGGLPWRTRAINYVWSRDAEPGAHWPNPFASQAEMVVVQGPGGTGAWHRFTRNVQADFKRFHGIEVDTVDAVAIMTDGDNTGTRVSSCYRLPVFRADAPDQRE
ncbi:DUF3047 domain-containing protein [Alcanivorax sp.]|uniref:DUF3047 domain-containing protein n=1 Tax=Alcanivorax sp. TaxID=1872427 RepID=UPI0032D9A45E